MFGMMNPMSAVTSQLPGGGDSGGDKEKEEEAERERQEAIAEAEERRKDKHRKMEEERESMRQVIRDKYNIKKKDDEDSMMLDADNPLMRKKKTPEEMEKEAEMADQDELSNQRKKRAGSPKRLFELKHTLETQVSDMKQQIEGKCQLQ